MSPSAALLRLLRAVHDRDADEIREAAEALAGWIEKGGFTPLIIDPVLKVAEETYDNTEDK